VSSVDGAGPESRDILHCPPVRHRVLICFENPGWEHVSTRHPPAVYIADLYRHRWRIEEAFAALKHLLGLSYLWTGSINGILLQVWSTWLFHAIFIDLADAVAEELMLPFDRISLEMVFRGLYHFIQAYNRGEATDPVKCLAAPENRDLGVVKRLRKKKPDLTDLDPKIVKL